MWCGLGPCTENSDLEFCWLPGQQRAAGWLETGWLVLKIQDLKIPAWWNCTGYMAGQAAAED